LFVLHDINAVRVDLILLATGDGTWGGQIKAMHCGEAKMKNLFKKFLNNKSGATAIEYGLIAALIAVAVIGGVSQLGSSANATFTTISGSM
jgi:pilus assembly protein Flp/PilA